MLGSICQKILWQVKVILYHATLWAALGDCPSGPLQNAPKRAATGAVSFGKSKEHITTNRAFDNRHCHARDAFEHFAFVFKAIFQYFYFYGFSTISFSDDATRCGQAVIARPGGQVFKQGFFSSDRTNHPQNCGLRGFSFRC